MKKKLLLAVGAFALILGIASNGTYAIFQADGEQATTQVSTTSLDISIDGDTSQVIFDNLVAGEIIEKQLSVVNSKEATLYTRVTIKKYWLDANGEKDFNESAENIQLKYNQTEWLEQSVDTNGEEIVLYYKTPLEQNQKTKNFIESLIIPQTFGNQDQDKKFALDIQVDAIQALNVEDAMLAQWGVIPTLDNSGTIINIER